MQRGGEHCRFTRVASSMPSSVIRDHRYDPVKRELDLKFVSGRRYRYHDVPAEIYAQMRRAFSKGEFFNEHIRDRFRFTPTH
jgi:lysyl-tRNA synthetase class 2